MLQRTGWGRRWMTYFLMGWLDSYKGPFSLLKDVIACVCAHVCACVRERQREMAALMPYRGIRKCLRVWQQVFLLCSGSAHSMALPQDKQRAVAVTNLDSFVWFVPRSKTLNKYRLKGRLASWKVFDSFDWEKKSSERSTSCFANESY